MFCFKLVRTTKPTDDAKCPSRTSRAPGLGLLTSITASLDPRLQAARDDERAARTLQTTQLVSTSNQLRDAHITINLLLLQCEHEHANAARRADRLEMQLEMARLVRNGRDRRPTLHTYVVKRNIMMGGGGIYNLGIT
jgi:hypothetical protein